MATYIIQIKKYDFSQPTNFKLLSQIHGNSLHNGDFYLHNLRKFENVVYYNYMGSMITNDGRCTRGMKSRTAIAKVALNKITFSSANWN